LTEGFFLKFRLKLESVHIRMQYCILHALAEATVMSSAEWTVAGLVERWLTLSWGF
jgi:hypothetical protein